ncbi:hypothetical protein [Nocardia sp. GAS34]|jgi:hypothetical protein|uniref:hypothetical protein n=1 Tax=unclassified Nocardia TaxID=2637762 RepID=UPI003D1CDC6A
MADYRGLTVDQFAEVRELVDRTRVEVPEVRLEFNDILVRPPATRTMPLYQMTEQAAIRVAGDRGAAEGRTLREQLRPGRLGRNAH